MQVPNIQYRLCGIQRDFFDHRGLLQHDTLGTVTTIDIFSKQFFPFPYISGRSLHGRLLHGRVGRLATNSLLTMSLLSLFPPICTP